MKITEFFPQQYYFQRSESLLFYGKKALLICNEGSNWIRPLQKNFSSVDVLLINNLSVKHKFFDFEDQYDLVLIDKLNEGIPFLNYIFRVLKRSGRCYFSFYTSFRSSSEPGLEKLPGIEPLYFQRLVLRASFTFYQSGPYGQMISDWVKHDIIGNRSLFIWESIFYKPEHKFKVAVNWVLSLRSFVSYIYGIYGPLPKNALQVLKRAKSEKNRVYFWKPIKNPVLTNFSESSFPPKFLKRTEVFLEHTGRDNFLKKIAVDVCDNIQNEYERIFALVRFVQNAFHRNPVTQPLNAENGMPDSVVSLLSGQGRCGHANAFLVDLLNSSGFKASIWQLKNHVSALVEIDAVKYLIDADMFKDGIIPLKDNRLISQKEIMNNPYVLDHLPQTGWVYGDISEATKVFMGNAFGYVDAKDVHEIGFPSFYFGAQEKGYSPSSPKNIQISFEGEGLTIKWDIPILSKSGQPIIDYEVRISSESRLIKNQQYKNKEKFFDSSEKIFRTKENLICLKFNDLIKKPDCFIIINARTSWVEKNPDTFFWPSEEIHITLPNRTGIFS